MRPATQYTKAENHASAYRETLRLGLRIYRGLISNSLGVKVPLFCGHKLTYNCNLKCKMCPFWLSLIHISEPTRLLSISYAVFCLKKKKKKPTKNLNVCTPNKKKHKTTQKNKHH